MSSAAFDYGHLFAKGLPEPAPRFTGLPRYNFTGGHNDPEQIPVEGLAAAAAEVIRREGRLLSLYNLGQGPLGYLGLREFLVDKLARHRGVEVSPENVLVTSGSGQGIDFVNRLLVEPGDTVIVEAFSYTASIKRARSSGATVVAAPLDEHGLVIDALERILADLKQKGVMPKYVYTIPTIQNPTGSILPLDRRQALVALCQRYGVPIFEDECYADLIFSGNAPPALYALAPDSVIHIGSFSKNLAPALRLGYVVAGSDVLSRMVAFKSDGGTGAINQMVAAEYFRTAFDDHMQALNGGLSKKLDVIIDALESEFGTAVEYVRPDGGIFIWIKLPDGVDTRKLVQPAAAAEVVFNPGPEWAVEPETATSFMRLCFALPSKEELQEGVATLARVCFEQTGIPARRANVRYAEKA